MTVLAYRDGIMAADTGVWEGDIICGFDDHKIVRMRDGGLLACAGSVPIIQKAKTWLLDDGPKPDKVECGEFAALIVVPDGRVFGITPEMDRYPMFGDFFMHGSHHEFLMGAMHAGASAPAAVGLAIEWCRYAAGRTRWMRLDGAGC